MTISEGARMAKDARPEPRQEYLSEDTEDNTPEDI